LRSCRACGPRGTLNSLFALDTGEAPKPLRSGGTDRARGALGPNGPDEAGETLRAGRPRRACCPGGAGRA
jgi:hypothetical protein